MGSTRLPGKSLLPLPLGNGLSLLAHVVGRARACQGIDIVVVATTTLPQDDAIAAAAAALGAAVFRGAEDDVLARFHHAAEAFGLSAVVRLTADNPAIDPHYISAAVAKHHAHHADYTLTSGLPLGTNTEVISASALAAAFAQASQPAEREHVTLYLRRHPEAFRLLTMELKAAPAISQLRLTVDFPSDYALLHLLYTNLPPRFDLEQVQAFVTKYPWVLDVNRHNEQIRP
ncbi:cytidylyltransferase domain-containing protein [Hymenobacter busanensis]|uniref:cytidylyltransferase domain-containing protein n=1 Tax=Hymenobacter busanensis TaxID=2607656 RepID=UPI0013675FB3|nr:NTP transferase domain-containing protein [Hymenobacter busanensis]QHJ06779.1 NTP transferase domain-containing protein [Hymenobacter busanensis]